jgi:hypothetical protein
LRALRDPLTRAALALMLLAASAGSHAQDPTHPYFPLAVGNRWSFRCSIEGAPAPGKVLQIRQQVRQDGVLYHRAELTVGKDAQPLVQYLWVGADGGLRRSFQPAPESAELWLAADVARGSPQGDWVSAGVEKLPLPALPKAMALRVQTFEVDLPEVSAERRAAWRARYYVKAVGPAGDADGLGGRCDLVSFHLAKRKAQP